MQDNLAQIESQKLFLKYLWKQLGGCRHLGKVTRIPYHSFRNWRYRGAVPINAVATVAKKLGIPKIGLNYLQLSFLVDSPPTWKDVVKRYKLPPAVEAAILAIKSSK